MPVDDSARPVLFHYLFARAAAGLPMLEAAGGDYALRWTGRAAHELWHVHLRRPARRATRA